MSIFEVFLVRISPNAGKYSEYGHFSQSVKSHNLRKQPLIWIYLLTIRSLIDRGCGIVGAGVGKNIEN